MPSRGRRRPPPPSEEDAFSNAVDPDGNAGSDEFVPDPDADDADLQNLNDPNQDEWQGGPALGGGAYSTGSYGMRGESYGAATSPPLWEEATSFPTVRQIRVFKMDNGNPVSIGVIDAMCSEDDFIREFFGSMPVTGVMRFVCRPITEDGKDLKKQFFKAIASDHTTVARLRAAAAAAAQGNPAAQQQLNQFGIGAGQFGGWGGIGFGQPMNQDVFAAATEQVAQAHAEASARLEQREAENAARMEAERQRTEQAEKALTEERMGALRANVEMTDKLAERTIKAEKERAEFLLAQQQAAQEHALRAMQAEAKRAQEAEEARNARDREYHERLREDERRRQEREAAEWQRRLDVERLEMDRRRNQERADAEFRLQAEKALAEQRIQAEKNELELRKAMLIADAERAKAEAAARLQAEENRMRLEQERLDRIRKDDAEREERRARLEREDAERREKDRREEAERREREREREVERREKERREEAERAEQRRKDEIALALKNIEIQTERAREHEARLAENARLEREERARLDEIRARTEREAAESKAKFEAAAYERAEAARAREHEMRLREMDLAAKRDHDHAERMMALQKAQNSGGLATLTDMLGMNTPDLLRSIFGGKEGGETSWADLFKGAGEGLGGLISALFPHGLPVGPPPPQQPTPSRQAPGPNPNQPRITQQAQPPQRQPNPAQQAQPPQRQPNPTQPQERAAQPAPVPANVVVPDVPVTVPTTSPVPTAAEPTAEERALAAIKAKLIEGKALRPLILARDAGISGADQSAARKAVKKLLSEPAESMSPTQIASTVTMTFMTTPSLGSYLKAVTLFGAMAEAGATPQKALVITSLIAQARQALAEQSGGVLPEMWQIPFDSAEKAKGFATLAPAKETALKTQDTSASLVAEANALVAEMKESS